MKYRLIHRSSNHQLFINSNGEVVIADQSGDTPDHTDDGPLIVPPDAQVVIGYDDFHGAGASLYFRVKVLVGRDGTEWSSVLMNLQDFRALLKELPGLHIDESPEFTRAHKELQEAWVMALCAPNNQPEEV